MTWLGGSTPLWARLILTAAYTLYQNRLSGPDVGRTYSDYLSSQVGAHL